MSDAAAAPAPGAPREAASDGAPRSARELVLDVLLDADGPMTPDTAMAATGITSRDSVHQALHRLVEAGDAIRVETGLYVKARPGAKRPPLTRADGMAKFIASAPDGSPLKPAPPKPAVPEADVELFTELLRAVNGHVNTNHPPGGGVTDLRVPKAMIANGASLEADILPVLRAHVGELAQRPIASWSEPWFVKGVAESHRRRLAAAPKRAVPAAPAIDDGELLDALMDAAGGNYYTNTSILDDLSPVRVILADGLDLEEDVLAALRTKVDRRQAPSAPALESWAQPTFLAAVAETHLRRVLIPAMVETWTRKARGAAVQKPGPPAAVSAPSEARRRACRPSW
jgi:hypothetical protein